MAEPLVGFSQRDLQRLKEHLRKIRNTPVNTTGRPPTPVHSVYMDTSQAPEVYIALIPSGGLPGAEIVGTAGGPPTSLSGVECQIYELTEHNGVLRVVDELIQRVYNLSPRGIPGGGWALVVREKGGTWIALAALGSLSGDTYGEGQCQFARLNSDDCVLITYYNSETGETEEYYLPWDSTTSTWRSTETFLYPGGSGTFIFGYADGRFSLLLNELELINCGDGCYTGSWITGHGSDETGTSIPISTPCNATAFTVCVECSCCPIEGWEGEGWYCVNDLTTGTGTGTTAEECEVVYLLDEDKCDDSLKICSGPYDTEAEAEEACTPLIVPAGGCGGGNPPAEIPVPYSASYDISSGVIHSFWAARVSGQIYLKVTGSNITVEVATAAVAPSDCSGLFLTSTCIKTSTADAVQVIITGGVGSTGYTIETGTGDGGCGFGD